MDAEHAVQVANDFIIKHVNDNHSFTPEEDRSKGPEIAELDIDLVVEAEN